MEFGVVRDEELMRALQRGDRGAAEELVRRYHRLLMAYFYRASLDYHLAQDLAQECLFRVVSRAELYRYPAPLKPWLYRIAANLWRDHLKSAAHHKERTTIPFEDGIPQWESDPIATEDAVIDRVAAGDLLKALGELPTKYAEVLLLRFGQGLTVPEIASALDLPEGTVKSRIFHGLRRLRSRMLEEAVERG